MPCGQCLQYLYRDRFDRNEENPSIGPATMVLRLPDCRPFVIICIRSSHGFSDLPPSPILSSSLHFAMASGICSGDPGLADQRDQTMSAAADRPPTSQPSGSQDRSLVFIGSQCRGVFLGVGYAEKQASGSCQLYRPRCQNAGIERPRSANRLDRCRHPDTGYLHDRLW